LCDWAAMSRKFGDTPQEFFNKNRYKMVLHPETVAIIERKLSVQLTTACTATGKSGVQVQSLN